MSQSTKQTNKTNLEIADRTNQANLDIAQMSNEYNMQMLDKQIAEQWKMWQAENEYNSPSAQRQRREEAGYNPFMDQDGGTASSMTAPSAAPAVTPTMVGATMQPGMNGLEAFLGTVQGITELLGSYTQNRLGAEQVQGQSVSNYIARQSALSEIQMRRSNAAIASVTARNEETRQNLNIAAQNLSNEAAYQSIYGHAVQNMKASMELSALPQQLQLGLSHLAADLKLKYQQGDMNEVQIRKVIAEIRNVRLEGDYMDKTMDSRVRQSAAEATAAENNQYSNNQYQAAQKFLEHFVLDETDDYPFQNMIKRTPSGSNDTVNVSGHWWR